MDKFEVREIHPKEMKTVLEWGKREGWNPGLYDEKCFYSADPHGYFVGVLNEEIVSMISAIKYGESYGFIGFYIVRPDFRSKGYGIKVWNKAIDYLNGRIIGLDGVPVQVENYKKSGFVYAHKNITFKGKAKNIDFDKSGIVKLTINDLEKIKAYDRLFFPEERDVFLKCWLEQKESYTIGIIDGGKLKAYGKIRNCPEAYKIGPLYAENYEKAEKLLVELQNHIPINSEYTIDIPEPNAESIRIAKKYNMEYFFETARMYKKETPIIDLSKVFGISSYELG